jgi:hypothetical protein
MPRGQGHNPTKQEFGDAQIHLEFRFEPAQEKEYDGKSQLYGNSGVFLMSSYEMQVVNSFQNDTFADGFCGAVYGQHPPLVNASRAPGRWQSYDILYKAPRFKEDGSLVEPMRLTAHHNGHLIHNDAWVYGEVGGPYKAHGKRPLMIQDHKGTGVDFRNLWIVPGVEYEDELYAFKRLFKSELN